MKYEIGETDYWSHSIMRVRGIKANMQRSYHANHQVQKLQ